EHELVRMPGLVQAVCARLQRAALDVGAQVEVVAGLEAAACAGGQRASAQGQREDACTRGDDELLGGGPDDAAVHAHAPGLWAEHPDLARGVGPVGEYRAANEDVPADAVPAERAAHACGAHDAVLRSRDDR